MAARALIYLHLDTAAIGSLWSVFIFLLIASFASKFSHHIGVCVSAYFDSHLNLSGVRSVAACRLSFIPFGFECARERYFVSSFVFCLAHFGSRNLYVWTWTRTQNKNLRTNELEATRNESKITKTSKRAEKKDCVCRYTLVFVLNRTTIRPY